RAAFERKSIEPGVNTRQVFYARNGIEPILAHELVLRRKRADHTPTDNHSINRPQGGRLLNKRHGVHDAVLGREPSGPGDASCHRGTPAVGAGHGITVGTVTLNTTNCGTKSQLIAQTRGGGRTTNMGMLQVGMGTPFIDPDNTWGNGTLLSAQSTAAEAHYGIAMTWDYFLNVHGRNGIADDGVGALARVHYGRNYVNA